MRPSKRTKLSPVAERMMASVKEMDATVGYDAVIVCTSNAAQEAYWQV